jgi:hypothetical protein
LGVPSRPALLAVVITTAVITASVATTAAVRAAAAGALHFERHPRVAAAPHLGLDPPEAGAERREAGEPLEPSLARDLDAGGPALAVAKSERAGIAVHRYDGALELAELRGVRSGLVPAPAAGTSAIVRAAARTVIVPMSFM